MSHEIVGNGLVRIFSQNVDLHLREIYPGVRGKLQAPERGSLLSVQCINGFIFFLQPFTGFFSAVFTIAAGGFLP